MHRPPRSRAAQDYEYRRAYKACIPCKRRKVKCQIRTEGRPCTRCAQKGLDCRFTAKKPWARQKDDETRESTSERDSNDNIPHICYPTATDATTTSGLHRMVSTTNDALDILFRTAVRESTGSQTPGERNTAILRPGTGSDPQPEVLRIWNACRFVKMGWFTAREAVMFVDLYVPIITDFFSIHANHYWLITQEPMLCCVILLISSRHHVIPRAGGSSRGHSIHNRLWQHCQHLILRIMLGQEKLSKAKTRHIGSIEALLLLAEWYPRALHFPPENDGWDSALMMATPDRRDPPVSLEETVTMKERWREDVIEPTRRADRMAWMVLSCAVALSHELGVFRSGPRNTRPTDPFSPGMANPTMAESDSGVYMEQLERRRRRLPPLLFVFVNMLASRMGCTSLMAGELGVEIWERLVESTEDRNWVKFMASWVELTRLTRGITDQYFPLAPGSDGQRQHGTETLQVWRDRLSSWQERRPGLHDKRLCDILNIEHQHLVVFINSIHMQTLVEKRVLSHEPDIKLPVGSVDRESVMSVIDSSCSILRWIVELEECTPRTIQYLPISNFHRVISTSIFLLKALALGVRTAQGQECLELLDKVSDTLQSSVLDDIHLVARYAVLLKVHVERVRKTFTDASTASASGADAGALKDKENNGAANPETSQERTANPDLEIEGALQENILNQSIFGWTDGLTSSADDWLSLPLDPLMAPFGTWDETGQTDLGLDSAYLDLDFIWNLPP